MLLSKEFLRLFGFIIAFLVACFGVQVLVDPFGLFWRENFVRDSTSERSNIGFQTFDSLALLASLNSASLRDVDFFLIGDSRLDAVDIKSLECWDHSFKATIGGASFDELVFLLAKISKEHPQATILVSLDALNFHNRMNRFRELESLLSQHFGLRILLSPQHLLASIKLGFGFIDAGIRSSDSVATSLVTAKDIELVQRLPRFEEVASELQHEFLNLVKSPRVQIFAPKVYPSPDLSRADSFRDQFVFWGKKNQVRFVNLRLPYEDPSAWYDAFHFLPWEDFIGKSLNSYLFGAMSCEG